MPRRTITAAVVVLALLLSACATGGGGQLLSSPSAPQTMTLGSTAFSDGGVIPTMFTCDGAGVSPRLTWAESIPAEEFVLLVTDPDAPGGTFVHWVVYAISSIADSIGEGQGPAGAKQGVNDFDRAGYGPPCPPPGDEAHRYVFTVYALSSPQTRAIPAGATAATVLKAIACCVQEQGTITATYRR